MQGIERLTEVKKYKSILGYGPPGGGKTWFATRVFGQDKKRLIMDVDRKYAESVSSMPGIQNIRPNVDVWMPTASISGSKHIGIVRIERKDEKGNRIAGTEGYIPLDPHGYKEIIDFINHLADLDPFPYDVVVEDTLSTHSEHLESLILNHHKTSTFSLPLWGVYKRNMIEWKSGFLSLPCHKVALAHENVTQNEDTSIIQSRPSILGSYKEEIGKDFTEVYFFLGEVLDPADNKRKFMVRTRGNTRYMARTTMPNFRPEESLDTVLAQLEKVV